MSKVSVKLQGGLGNLLFQISCCYAYSLKHNKEYVFTYENFHVVHKHIESYKENIFKKIEFNKSYETKKFKQYFEPSFSYLEIPEFKEDICLNGYFQSEKYFKKFKKEILELFAYEIEIPEKIKNVIDNKVTCSIV
jgi:hypothetical protein